MYIFVFHTSPSGKTKKTTSCKPQTIPIVIFCIDGFECKNFFALLISLGDNAQYPYGCECTKPEKQSSESPHRLQVHFTHSEVGRYAP